MDTLHVVAKVASPIALLLYVVATAVVIDLRQQAQSEGKEDEHSMWTFILVYGLLSAGGAWYLIHAG